MILVNQAYPVVKNLFKIHTSYNFLLLDSKTPSLINFTSMYHLLSDHHLQIPDNIYRTI